MKTIEQSNSTLIDLILNQGANNAAIIETSRISFDPGFRSLCESNACGNYGKCWMCPPDAGDINELMNELKEYKIALLYQTISRLEDSYDFEGMMIAAKRHNDIADKISNVLNDMSLSHLHLGAGGCHYCDICAKRENKPCRHPDKAKRSLEVYGVNVSETAKACGLKYINGCNTVTYFGAVFFNGKVYA